MNNNSQRSTRINNTRSVFSLIDSRKIEVFLASAKHQSFSKAGDELLMTQSAISTQIKHLEEIVGTQLFSRSNKVTTLTDAGHVFLEYSESLFSKADAFLDTFLSSRNGEPTSVTIDKLGPIAQAKVVSAYREELDEETILKILKRQERLYSLWGKEVLST